MFATQQTSKVLEKTINRRQALKLGAAGFAAASVPFLGMSRAEAASSSWRVNIQQPHTGEGFSGVYRVGDDYIPEVFEELNYVLRDRRTGQAFPMDPRVLDIAAQVQRKIGVSTPLHVLCAYRSPKTNKDLRSHSRGVAKNSYHMYGQALDIRIPEISTTKLRDVAKGLKAGGVGYYPKSGFVHVDTGDVRTW